MLKVWNIRSEIDIYNNIEYDVELNQVRTIMVKYTEVRI